MKVLVIGGGGREHALAWKLAASPRVRTVSCTRGTISHWGSTRWFPRTLGSIRVRELVRSRGPVRRLSNRSPRKNRRRWSRWVDLERQG